MRINLGEDEQPEIGLIALIDCIFFLLMFFMVATSFKQPPQEKKQKELPVTLPTSQVSLERDEAGAAPLIIGADKDGKLFLDGEPGADPDPARPLENGGRPRSQPADTHRWRPTGEIPGHRACARSVPVRAAHQRLHAYP